MFTLFSVDDHIVEPPGVWVDRVSAAYKDRVPHMVEAGGRQMWVRGSASRRGGEDDRCER